MLSDGQSASNEPSIYALDGPGPEQISPPLPTGRSQVPSAVHTRDPSVTRGRTQQPSTQTYGPGVTASSRAGSVQPQAIGSDGSARGGPAIDTTGLQRRTSNNYGHHRQTSVIHGLQHSRSPSFNSPASASPLSPESLLNAPAYNRYPGSSRRGQSSNASVEKQFSIYEPRVAISRTWSRTLD